MSKNRRAKNSPAAPTSASRPLAPIVLPNRRPGLTLDFQWPRKSGRVLQLAIGLDPKTGRPAEVFLKGQKVGSESEEIADACMISISKLLQAGSDPAELADTFGRSTMLGAVCAVVAEYEPAA